MNSDRPNVTKFNILRFVASKVPLVLFCGIKVESVRNDSCLVTMKRNWRNRNPYGGAYFAATLAAAEMATGIMVFDELIEQKKRGFKVPAYIDQVDAMFYRQITGKASFVCHSGEAIRSAVQDAVDNRTTEMVRTIVYVTNERGKSVAKIKLDWCIAGRLVPKHAA